MQGIQCDEQERKNGDDPPRYQFQGNIKYEQTDSHPTDGGKKLGYVNGMINEKADDGAEKLVGGKPEPEHGFNRECSCR